MQGSGPEVRERTASLWFGSRLTAWSEACARLTRAGYGEGVAEAYRLASLAIAPVVGPEAAVDLADHVSTMAIRAGPQVASEFAARAEPAAHRLREPALFSCWMEVLVELAASAPESVEPVLWRMDELLCDLDVAALRSWLRTGVQAAAGDRDRRRAFFAGESREGERLLAWERGETSFAEVDRRTRAFFVALWGLRPRFQEVPVDRRGGAHPRVSFSRSLVTVPTSFPGYRGRLGEELFRAALAHVGAHLVFGGPPFPVARSRPLERAVVSVVEDARVEHLAMRRFPGLVRLWLPFHEASASGPGLVPALLARLARALFDPDHVDDDGWVRKGRDLFFAARDSWGDPRISRTIGNVLANDLGQMRLQFDPHAYVVEPPYRDDGVGLWAMEGDIPPASWACEIPMETVRPHHIEGDDGRPGCDPGSGRATTAVEPTPAAEIPVVRLPEWDYGTARFRPEWVTVLETTRVVGSDRFFRDAIDRHPDVAARIDALVRAARVSRAERLRRRPEGETLDLDAAVQALADLRAGRTPDVAVYQSSARRRRDLTVSLVLDASRSTADRAPDGRGTVLDLVRDAAALVGHAMNAMGDPFEIFAFDSDGRDAVRIHRIKAYEEPFGSETAAALAGLAPGRSTRIGAVLRYAAIELLRQRTHRRLVLLVTDGEPADVDCPDARYLVEDARHATIELRRLGLDVFCLLVGAGYIEVATRIFGPRGFTTVPRITALPERLPSLYFRLAR